MMHYRSYFILGGLILVALVAVQPVIGQAAMPAAVFTRISTSGISDGGGGSYAAISQDGQVVVFESPADDLAPEHLSGSWDVFAHDRQASRLELVSTRSGGDAVHNPGDYTSPPAVTGDGRMVAFMSLSSQLVIGDDNEMPDIFIHDRQNRITELVSVSSTGKIGNGPAFNPAVSTDGRYIVFQSLSSNLTPGDQNEAMDVFLRDRALGVTELISVTSDGQQGVDPHEYGFSSVAVSADGRFVAFAYQYLPVEGTPADGEPAIYLRDRQNRTTRLIGPGLNPALSANGRYLAFVTSAVLDDRDQNEGEDIYLIDLQTGQLERVSGSQGGGEQGGIILCPPSLSADGQFVAFATSAQLTGQDNNLAADIYLRDRSSDNLRLVTLSADGQPGNDDSGFPALSADGSSLAFTSLASNLAPGDVNARSDVFLYSLRGADQQPEQLTRRAFFPVVRIY